MSLLELSIISSFGIKTVVFLIYSYLYWQYRERFLGYWTLAWGLILLKSTLDPFIFNQVKFIPSVIAFQITNILGTLFLALGTCDFIGKRIAKFWLYSAGFLILLSTVGICLGWPLFILAIPNVLMYGFIYIHTGLILLNNLETQGLGKKITAYSFILVGIHQFDFPLFRPDLGLAHWGYLLDSFLRLTIGIGFLLTYFEKTRYDLTRKEEQFRLLAENAKDIIYRYQLLPTPHVEYISPVVAEITGFKPEEYYTDPELINKIIHPEDQPLLQHLNQPFPTDSPITLRLLHKNQNLLWVEQHIVPVYDQEGHLAAVEGIIRDVTTRKQLEQELFRLDRLNIVGQMAANIGHEIRNPLTTVRGYLQVLARKKDLTAHQDNIALMLDELDRANSLITEYLSLSKHRLTDLKPHNLNAIIQSIFPLLQAMVAPHYRSSQAFYLLTASVYETTLCRGCQFNFTGGAPFMVGLHEQIGYRRYKSNFSVPDYGYMVPSVYLLRDINHLRQIRSPFYRIARKTNTSSNSAEWFTHAFPEAPYRYANNQLLSKQELWQSLCLKLGQPPEKAISLFHGLNESEAMECAQAGHVIYCEQGDTIVHPDDMSNGIFIIVSGSLMVRKQLADRRITPTLLLPGQTFGERTFSTHVRQRVTVNAWTDTELLVLPRHSVDRLQLQHPEIAAKLLHNILPADAENHIYA